MNRELAKKIGIWFLAIALFMAHLFFRSVAHAEEGSAWKSIVVQNGECQIAFPSPPERVQQSLKLSEHGQRLTYDLYLAPFEDRGVFLLLIAKHPLPLGPGHEIAGLEGLLRGIVGHSAENELLFANWVECAGSKALDFLVQGGATYFRGRALMIGSHLFLIAMEGRRGTLDEEVFSRFVQSFKKQSLS